MKHKIMTTYTFYIFSKFPISPGDLLESILSKDACKVGLPNIERLLVHPFWQENIPKFYEQFANANDSSKQSLKLTNNAKEQIKIAIQKSEQRLRDEQKSVSTSTYC